LRVKAELVSAGGGKHVDASSLIDGKSLVLYFSAHWCPPCQAFTPEFAKTYKAMRAHGKDDFEVIFVSSDSDKSEFESYHADMPWPALPYSNRAGKNGLSRMFSVEGIPTVIVLGPDRKVLSSDARSAISNDPDGANFPWLPPLVDDLEDCSKINENLTVVALADGCDDKAVAECWRMLEVVAAETRVKGDTTAFAVAGPNDGLAKRVRSITQLKDATQTPELILVDIDAECAYQGVDGDITLEAIRKLISDASAGSAEKRELSF